MPDAKNGLGKNQALDAINIYELLVKQVELVYSGTLRGDIDGRSQALGRIIRAPAKIGDLVVVTAVHPKQPYEDRIGWLKLVEHEPAGMETPDDEPTGYIRYWTIERLSGDGDIRWTNVQVLRVAHETRWDHIEPVTKDE